MKFCSKCGAQMEDNVAFCPSCGAPMNGGAPVAAVVSSTDHTAEFDAQDISDNKVVAMIPYLTGWIGIIIAAILTKDSPYVQFHIRQALKLNIVNMLLALIAALLCWTFIVPFAAFICMGIVTVLQIIAFFQVCGGKAKEPAIISGLKFLK